MSLSTPELKLEILSFLDLCKAGESVLVRSEDLGSVGVRSVGLD